MHSVLKTILETTTARIDRSASHRSNLERKIEALPATLDFKRSLKQPGRRIIAEVKRTSPSEGRLRTNVMPQMIASSYETAGAAAISVLTEPSHFDGSLEDLARTTAETTIPCLRKDFILDEIQILEARAAGAAAYLLIVAALNDRQLTTLISTGSRLGLAALVEVHTAEELKRAEQAGASIIGVNNRDLNSLAIDLS